MSLWAKLFRSDRTDDLNAEIESHLRMAAQDMVDRGATPDEARYAARREFGNVGLVQEVSRETWVSPIVDRIVQDARYAWRGIRQNPGFASVAVCTLALGIGSCTGVFTVINAALLANSSYPNRKRLFVLHQIEPSLGADLLGLSTAEFFDYKTRNRTCVYLSAYEEEDYDVTGGGREPQRMTGVRTSWNLFPALGVAPVFGSLFSKADDLYGARKVAVLSYGFWRQEFGGSRDVLGRTIRLNERPYTILGVMPAGFEFPAERTSLAKAPALWVPMQFSPDELRNRVSSYDLSVVGLLKPGISLEQAGQDMRRIVNEFEREHPDVYNGNLRTQVMVDKLGARELARYRSALLILVSAVIFVLLIACANVANLLVARLGTRRHEGAIRCALGASGRRLSQQLLTEGVILSTCGALLGLTLAEGVMHAVIKVAPPEIRDLENIQLDWRVLVCTSVLAICTGLLCSLAPAADWRSANVSETLKRSSRTMSEGRVNRSMKKLLVTLEAALALILLIGSGLLIRSFQALLQVPPGFDPHGVIIVRTSFNRNRYDNALRRHNAERLILARLRGIPGVQTASLTTHVPLADSRGIGFVVEGAPPNEFHWADNALVDGAYFEAMRIPLLEGRTFSLQDASNAKAAAAIINQSMAQEFWPHNSALGKTLFWGGRRLNVIAVAGNVHIQTLDIKPRSTIYNSVFQVESGATTSAVFILRTKPGLRQITEAARNAIRSVDPELPVFAVDDMASVVARSIADRTFIMLLLSMFASLALVLAIVGLYGVLSYAVAQRAREFGVRIAVGAEPGRLIRIVLRDGLLFTVAGIALGLIGGVALAFAMAHMLFEIHTLDLVSFVGAAAALLVTSVLASLIPAWRAGRVDPLTALRCE
jgi:putative ABC transport system permease protein